MRGQEIADRQAQWARFGAWEKRQTSRLTRRLAGEEALRAVGEMVEFYLAAATPLLVRRSVAAKVEGVQRLQRALRSVAPRG